jgi:hypothetical protein
MPLRKGLPSAEQWRYSQSNTYGHTLMTHFFFTGYFYFSNSNPKAVE